MFFGSECVLDGVHHVDGILTVFFDQNPHFVQADAVFARAGAAHFQRTGDDALVQAFGFLQFLGLGRIEQHRDVEIAVADVADDRARQVRRHEVLLRFLDAFREIGTQTSVVTAWQPGFNCSMAK